MKENKLTLYIFIALLAGIVLGVMSPEIGVKMYPLAMIFLRMVKMIIAPLLFATLVVGIAGHGSIKGLGKLGLKTIIYFEIVTTFALVIGLIAANVFKPGVGFNVGSPNFNFHEAELMAATNSHNSLYDMVINIFPTSVIDAMATGNLLQIVVFSIFFALAICTVGEKAEPVLNFLKSLSEIMFKFTGYVMYFAPLGIFGAIAYTVGNCGIKILSNYVNVIFSLYATLFIFLTVLLYVTCKIVKISVKEFIKAIAEPAILTFTTASSEAGFPKAIEIMEKFGVPKNIVGFVMPTGYTFNLDGSTLYLAIAVIFSAQITGLTLSLEQQIIIMLALMLTSKGVAGVPRMSLIVLAGTLASFDIPLLGVAVLLGIDQILDMGRTTVNLIGNCIATAVIAKWENKFDYDKMNKFIEEKRK